VDQYQTAQHFSDPNGALRAVDDARVRHSACMEAQEIGIVRDQHTSGCGSQRELRRILRSDQPGLSRGRDVNLPAA